MFDWNLLRLVERFLEEKWGRIRYKKGKPLNCVTTNDLNAEGKLFPDYKERRKRRKEKRNKSKAFESIDLDELF